MTTLEETIPVDEEGAMLLHKPKSIRLNAVGDGGISITTSKKAESDGGFCYKKN